MQETACDRCRKELSWWQKLLGFRPCPNMVESWWVDAHGNKQIVRDCAPKRTMLMAQESSNQLVSIQRAVEEARNEYVQLQMMTAKLAHDVQSLKIDFDGEYEDDYRVEDQSQAYPHLTILQKHTPEKEIS